MEFVILWNKQVITRYRFRPRILIDVSNIDMTTTVLGFKISMPIMIAPTAFQKMAHPEGIPLFHLIMQKWAILFQDFVMACS